MLDSHVHFWDPRRMRYGWLTGEPELDRPFLPEALAAARPAGGAGILVVEADREPQEAMAEVDWIASLARAGAPVRGIVAHVPLERGTACRAALAALAARPLVVGVRRLLQDQPGGFALRPDFLEGVRLLADYGFVFDVCVRHRQIPEVTELARRCPQVTFVLDHLGKPAVALGTPSGWAADLDRLAALPNVVCKLSGLTSEADTATRTQDLLVSYLRRALDVFGPRRCLFGSDWPVCSLTTTYVGWLDTVRAALADLTAADRGRVMIGTAEAVYGLGGRAVGPEAVGSERTGRWL